MPDTLEQNTYFTTSVYMVDKPEFLPLVREISDRYLEAAREHYQNSLTVMTAGYSHEESLLPFSEYVSQTAWNILMSQGYAMGPLVTFFSEMWTQEHQQHSGMDTHVHPHGAQISAFYFLTVPENSCRLIIHDPRPGKVMSSLREANDEKVTPASGHVVFTPREGMLLFTNAWLPHSFSRNQSSEPMQFVHMNVAVAPAPQPEVEVL